MKHSSAIRIILVVLALMISLCAPAMAKTLSPGEDFYYLDNAGVLSEELEGEIFFSNKLLYDACGAQIVVVTVDTTGHEAIDDYAYDLFNRWGIGDVSKSNGFLLLLAIEDDDYYALPGSGLDSRFSAGTIKSYYDQYLEADFAAKRYEAGVKKFYEAVFERVADTYNADVTVAQGVADYQEYVARNAVTEGYGGYNGSRRVDAVGSDYGRDEDSGLGLGVVIFVVLLIVLIVLLSKGRRARRRAAVMPPPPPTPQIFGGVGYRPTRTIYHGPTFGATPPRSSGWSSGWSSGSSRSSFGGGSSTRSSSFGGGSSSRSSFGGGSSRSSGFGGGHSGGGRTSGGGAGRGRH